MSRVKKRLKHTQTIFCSSFLCSDVDTWIRNWIIKGTKIKNYPCQLRYTRIHTHKLTWDLPRFLRFSSFRFESIWLERWDFGKWRLGALTLRCQQRCCTDLHLIIWAMSSLDSSGKNHSFFWLKESQWNQNQGNGNFFENLKAVHAWMLLGILIQDAVAAAFKRFSFLPMTTIQSVAKHKEKCSNYGGNNQFHVLNEAAFLIVGTCQSEMVRSTLKWHQHNLAEKVTDRQVVGCFSGSGHERYLWQWIVEC